jgi:uncharacterized protein (TIGR02266 family)
MTAAPLTLDEMESRAERRTAHRVDLAVDIGFESDTNFFTGFSEDLSDGGLFIATYQTLPVGTSLGVSFVLPDGHAIKCTATVAWVRESRDKSADVKPGMGVHLQGLSSSDSEAIHRFLHERAPFFYAL